MSMDQMEVITLTLMLHTTSQESELILEPQVPERTAKLVTGPPFTGLLPSRTEELSLTLELSSVVFQRPSLLVLTKSSHVGTSQFQSSSKELRQDLTAHHTLLGDKPTPGPQLVESQSHSDLMLISMLRLSSATELQSSLNTTINQLPPPCNQTDACGSIWRNQTPPETKWF